MSILIDQSKKVLIQGITGREGMARTRLMKEFGTQVVGGCTPGKGGTEVLDLPVFDTVEEAVERLGPVDISVLFVPAPFVKMAAFEAMDAGIPLLVIIPDRVPVWDVVEIADAAKASGTRFVGPNTLGVLSPGKAVLGMMGGRAENARRWFKQGPIGLSSRSGGITSSIAYYLGKEGLGLTTMVHVGGDGIVGLPHPQVLSLFEKDPDTRLMVMFGEIGTSQEETVAEMMMDGKITKPVVAFIGGKAAQKGTRFSHAGAIIEGNRGTHEGKVACLKEAGAILVDDFDRIPDVTAEVLASL